jgi:hypothetical protein
MMDNATNRSYIPCYGLVILLIFLVGDMHVQFELDLRDEKIESILSTTVLEPNKR